MTKKGMEVLPSLVIMNWAIALAGVANSDHVARITQASAMNLIVIEKLSLSLAR